MHRIAVDESNFTNTAGTLQNTPAKLTQEPTARLAAEVGFS
jgi:hypothetical protein